MNDECVRTIGQSCHGIVQSEYDNLSRPAMQAPESVQFFVMMALTGRNVAPGCLLWFASSERQADRMRVTISVVSRDRVGVAKIRSNWSRIMPWRSAS